MDVSYLAKMTADKKILRLSTTALHAN
ncbi:hypothetical protein CCACVL1_16495 [Corchorus capsularis]|uniref:Uncharacterized protein n=1 Tax=Corchorus capsularis TaxID=210143 RepID=A0A1R3HWK1_COCAP|nr:hypothetical protein CCACVL1_16495 [Corchorus capsularis]